MAKPYTTLNVSHKTQERLNKHGRYKETYDALLNRLLDTIEMKQSTTTTTTTAKKEEILSRCR